jgi:hypothetical protein
VVRLPAVATSLHKRSPEHERADTGSTPVQPCGRRPGALGEAPGAAGCHATCELAREVGEETEERGNRTMLSRLPRGRANRPEALVPDLPPQDSLLDGGLRDTKKAASRGGLARDATNLAWA